MSGRIGFVAVGETVYSRDRKLKGEVRSVSRRCQMEGCSGIRVGVRWPDGSYTYPCSRGMTADPDGALVIV